MCASGLNRCSRAARRHGSELLERTHVDLGAAIVRLQVDDESAGGGQGRYPALQCLFGRANHLTPLVDGAPDRQQRTAHEPVDALSLQRLLPRGDALAGARLLPARGPIAGQLAVQRGYFCCARVPLDQPVHLHQLGLVAGRDLVHQAHRIEARVQARQDWRHGPKRAQALDNGKDTLEVEVALTGGTLHAMAQDKFKSKDVAAEAGSQRAAADDASVGTAHALIGRAAVVRRDGVRVQRQPAAIQHTEVRCLAAQHALDHRSNEVEQIGLPRVDALATRRAGMRQAYAAERLLLELVGGEVLDGLEIARALYLQREAAVHERWLLAMQPLTGSAPLGRPSTGCSVLREWPTTAEPASGVSS